MGPTPGVEEEEDEEEKESVVQWFCFLGFFDQ